jgi:HEAT repeat protein
MGSATPRLRANQDGAVARPAPSGAGAWLLPAACALTLLAAPAPPAHAQAKPAVLRDVDAVNRLLRERAAREAVKSPPPKAPKGEYTFAELEQAAQLLASDIPSERARGTKLLGEAGAAAIPQLVAALEDPEERVRADAAKLLGLTRDARAAEPLVTRLGSADAEWNAVYDALWRIGAPAVPPLIEALGDTHTEVRRRAARLLGILRDGRATEALVGLLNKDRSTGVRVDIATALGRIGDRDACEALLDALHDW